MKKNIIFLICVALLCSCHKRKSDIVEGFVDAKNSYASERISHFLAEDFRYYDGADTINKPDYLKNDTLKYLEVKSEILKIQELDSIVATEEKIITIVDSLLKVTPCIVLKRTYRFSNDKLKSITVDSVMNLEEYSKDYAEKWNQFSFYINDQYDIEDDEELIINIKKYLAEYRNLPVSTKKKYKTYSNLQGTYVGDSPFYKKLIFRGKKTVTIIDAIFGLPFATSYEIDENYIRIRTDKSDLLFEIKDSETLIGEGFANGVFRKTK